MPPILSSTLPRRTHIALWLSLTGLLLGACGQGSPTPTAATTASAQLVTATPEVEGPPPTNPPATEPGVAISEVTWTVDFVQGDQVVSGEAGQVILAKGPFTLRVNLSAPLPVKLNLNADDGNFIVLQPGFVFTEDCLAALCTGMDVAEERLNPAQTLFVDPQSTHYIYYLGPDDHRWSRATVTDSGAVFERDVALLNDLLVEQFGVSELYLLLYVDGVNPGVIDPGELKKIMLQFQ